MNRLVWKSGSEAETLAFGEALGTALVAPSWVALTGDLGAGKTRLAAGIARGAGYLGRVRSPTFVLETRYAARTPVRHLDLYRLERPDDEMVASWDEDERSIVLVEWAERAAERPERTLELSIEATGPAATDRWIALQWNPRLGLLHNWSLPRRTEPSR